VRRWFFLLILLLAASAMATPAFSQAMSDQKESLYKRVGGYDAIAAVTDGFIGRMIVDPPAQQVLCRFQQRIQEAHPAAHRGLPVPGYRCAPAPIKART
jgi:hypothetical protein